MNQRYEYVLSMHAIPEILKLKMKKGTKSYITENISYTTMQILYISSSSPRRSSDIWTSNLENNPTRL